MELTPDYSGLTFRTFPFSVLTVLEIFSIQGRFFSFFVFNKKNAEFTHMNRHLHRHSPWLWIPALFVAEEIPLVLVSYLSLLVFYQLGLEYYSCTLLSAGLMLPWILKSFVRLKIRCIGGYRRNLFVAEFLIFLALTGVAVSLGGQPGQVSLVFFTCLLVSTLCAWHSSLSRMYYECVLRPREQRVYATTKRLSSQLSIIITYGVLIMLVGFLEVFFRSFSRAWSMANYLLGGGMLFLLVMNVLFMPGSPVSAASRPNPVSWSRALWSELCLIQRIGHQPHCLRVLSVLFMLLLPFSLLFYPRVFFLLGMEENGGLGCSLQDVGFAQGTIGVTAFMLGESLGRYFMQHTTLRRLYIPFTLSLTIPPAFYLLMSLFPQIGNMYALCIMTGMTQFCFGLGLNICRPFVRYVSSERHRGAATLIYLPLVVGETIIPMAVSGACVSWLGFRGYFVVLFFVVVSAQIYSAVNRRRVMEAFLQVQSGVPS